MRRTPLWVFVAAAGVQLAALGLCVWAMEHWTHIDDDAPGAPEETPAKREALNPAPPVVAADVAFTRRRPEGELVRPVQSPELPESRPAPVFGPPPSTAPAREPVRAAETAIPEFITEPADGTTQLVGGRWGDRPVAFGFYPDGNIRFVDVDGGRYAGKAESARARMREVDGTRAFTVQIGVAADGRLQATFTGGLHDAETLSLDPLVGWSVA